MPVLDVDPMLWPEGLFGNPSQPDPDHRWWAVHLRPRTEKSVARRLQAAQVGYFLPQRERRAYYQRRLVRSYLPLFPGYLFVYGDDDGFELCTRTKEVVSCLPVRDQQKLERKLRDLRTLVQSGEAITREERLEAGMPARIVKGPLAGLSGRVVRNEGGLKFVLEVQFIQQAASVKVDGAMIEAL